MSSQSPQQRDAIRALRARIASLQEELVASDEKIEGLESLLASSEKLAAQYEVTIRQVNERNRRLLRKIDVLKSRLAALGHSPDP